MDKEIYLHGIYSLSDYYDSKMTLKILKKILESNAILSARLQKKFFHIVLFNGIDYISLCDYEKSEKYRLIETNSYETYIRYSLSLIFPKDKIPVIEPEIIDAVYDYETIREYGLSEDKRYSDLPDEVQVKDKISLDLMTGITLPVSKMKNIFLNETKTTNMVLREIDKIRTLLDKYNHLVPLYDIDTFESLEKEENVKTLVKHYYKNRG